MYRTHYQRPVIEPTQGPRTVVLSPTLAQAEMENGEEVEVPEQPPPEKPVEQAKRRLWFWGGLGVLSGSIFNATIMSLAFRSYRRTGSTWGPALWSGLSSMIVGGGVLLLASRSFDRPLSQRTLSYAVGFKMAD